MAVHLFVPSPSLEVFEGPVPRAVTSPVVSRLIGWAFAGSCVVIGAFSIGPAFRDQPEMNTVWAWTFGLLLFFGLMVAAVSGFTMRRLRTTSALLSLVYLAMVVSWPLAESDPTTALTQPPWIWGVCNLAMAAAVIGLPPVSAGVYVFALSTVWALVRLTPAGGAAGLGRALQDAGYAYLLGMAIMVIVLYLRSGAAAVDDRQMKAITRYAKATREHETEKQRMAVDALLHDSVMTTLLHVSRAETAHEQLLAARMAITSLNVIADTEDHLSREQAPVTATEIRDRFEHIKAELGAPVSLTITGPDQHAIPWVVAETLFAAALQALVNSVQHGGEAVTVRTVTVTWSKSCVTVEIADDGVGFDPAAGSSRMGVRVSILERMEAVGGTGLIDSAPGRGARIALTWSDPSHEPTRVASSGTPSTAAPAQNIGHDPRQLGWASLMAGALSAAVGTLLLAHIAALPLAVFAAMAQVTLYVMLAYNTAAKPSPPRFLSQGLFVLAGVSQAVRGTAFLISPALHQSIGLTLVGAVGCCCAITGLLVLRRSLTETRFLDLLLLGASVGLGVFILAAAGATPFLTLSGLVLASVFEILAAMAAFGAFRRRH